MKRNSLWIFATIVVALLAYTLLFDFLMQAAGPAGPGIKGQSAASNLEKENFDIRDATSKDAVSRLERRLEKFSARQREENAHLKQVMTSARERKARSVAGLATTFSSLINSPEVVEVRGRGRRLLTPLSQQPRENIMREFIGGNADLFGMSPQQVAQLRKSADYTNPNGRLSWVKMEQRWNGMRIFRGEMVAAFTSGGELVRVVGELAGGPRAEELETAPRVSAAQAVVAREFANLLHAGRRRRKRRRFVAQEYQR
jgi:Fungalysin/Thermolysin Propeptide Motif